MLVDKFVEEVKAEVEADVENRMRKEKEQQLSDREQWNAQLSRREVLSKGPTLCYSRSICTDDHSKINRPP